MNEKRNRVRLWGFIAFFLLATAFAAGETTTNQEGARAGERWEYLVLSAPSATNLTPSGSLRMRKDPSGAFGREAFVLEQHMDKLGAQGWELVAVTESRSEPTFYFKRRK